MFRLGQTASFEQIVRKSRFRATALAVSSEDEARQAIAAASDPAANHNCWAWRIGSTHRFSDDGEPGGTAGRPILAVMEGQSVDQVAIVVTRWFGGVLLGTGGLVRAYGGTAGACLRAATLLPYTPSVHAAVSVDFSDLPRLKSRLLALDGVQLVGERFTASGAEIVLSIAVADVDAVSKRVSDLTRGKARLDIA